MVGRVGLGPAEELAMPTNNMMAYGCPMMAGAGGAWMMIGGAIVWLLTIVLLVLGIAALLKYLRSDRRPPQ